MRSGFNCVAVLPAIKSPFVMLSMVLWCLLADMKDLAWLAVPSSLSGTPMIVCSSFWKLWALAHPSEVDFATRFLVLVFMFVLSVWNWRVSLVCGCGGFYYDVSGVISCVVLLWAVVN